MILLMVALTTVACSKTYEIKPVNEGEIGFGTWAETLTKARATSSTNTAFADGDKFDVYGIKTVGSTNYAVFSGDDVKATVSGSTVTWDYDPHRFWDPAATSYTFYAVLPAGIVSSGDATTGLFTSSDYTFSAPAAFTDDILVADKTTVSGTGTEAPYTYSGKVEMKFNHAASCVDLYVRKDNAIGSSATVTVTDLSLLNISSSGHFTVADYTTHAPAPKITWTAATTPTTLGTDGVYTVLNNASVVAGVTSTYSDHSISSTTGTETALFTDYVFMPQSLTASTQQIKISYTIQIGSEQPNQYKDIVFDIARFRKTDTDNNSGEAITTWDAGTHYKYYLTIGANNVIQFTASVNNWASTTDGYYYLVK